MYVHPIKSNGKLQVLIICFILTPFLSLPSQPLQPSPLKLQNFTTQKIPLMSACCVCLDLTSLSHTR